MRRSLRPSSSGIHDDTRSRRCSLFSLSQAAKSSRLSIEALLRNSETVPSTEKRSCRWLALVQDSKLTVNDPNPEASHRPILYDSGRPSSVSWFRTLHATTDSATRPPRDRARSRSPRIDLYRKNACSTRAWSWEPASCFQRRRPSVRTSVIVRSRARDRGRRRDPPRGLGRWNHDSRVTHLRRVVERDRLVGRVSGHPCDLIVDRLNEVDANGRGIHRRIGQRVSDDHAHSINSKMQRLPVSVAASTVVHRSPFAFAHNRPSRAVDDAMDGSSRWDAAECNRERLTASGERGVVGGCEIDTHQRQDRPQAAFPLGARAPGRQGGASTPSRSHSPRTSSARLVDRTATGATRPWRRQRATASRPLAGPRPARTLTNAPRDPSSCTADGPLISCRDRAPPAVTVAREPTAASSQPKGCAPTPRQDGGAGSRCLATMGRPAWRTRSSGTRRLSETAFERAVRQGGGLRSSSRATS